MDPSIACTTALGSGNVDKEPTSRQAEKSITNEDFVAKPWLEKYFTVFNWFIYDVPGPGGKIIKYAWIINLQKGGIGIWCLFLMVYFDNWSKAMWLYLALHGSYGICWLYKDRVLPDNSFECYISLTGGFVAWTIVLFPYCWASYALASGMVPAEAQEPSNERMFVAVITYVFGVVLMMGADGQKTFTLKLKKGLIDSGFSERTRNPNYLGEIMLYASFNIVAQAEATWYIYIVIWCFVFLTRMAQKDYSLSKKIGWNEYKAKSWLLLPKVFASSTILSILFYVAFAGAVFGLVHNGGVEKTLKSIIQSKN